MFLILVHAVFSFRSAVFRKGSVSPSDQALAVTRQGSS